MKRKTFILMSTVVLAGVIVPVYVNHEKYAPLYRPLVFPESLSKLFDKRAIKEIGSAYLSKNLSESDAGRLKELLLTDSSGKVHNEDEKTSLREMLNKGTKKDFETGKIIVLNGWVLSLTEARQCALFSLTDVQTSL